MLKPNCQKCFYSDSFNPKECLASCSCENVAEEKVTSCDNLFKVNKQYVKRNTWDEECDCSQFIPLLTEYDNDFELQTVHYFETEFNCPTCDSYIYVEKLELEEVRHIVCDNCGMTMVVQSKSI